MRSLASLRDSFRWGIGRNIPPEKSLTSQLSPVIHSKTYKILWSAKYLEQFISIQFYAPLPYSVLCYHRFVEAEGLWIRERGMQKDIRKVF